MHTNGGHIDYIEKGQHTLFPIEVCYNERSIANIVLLKHILQIPGSRVTMDTNMEDSITVHVNGTAAKFNPCKDGLYFHDPYANDSSDGNNKNKALVISHPSGHCSLLDSVSKNKSFYNKKETKLVDEAMQLLQCLGHP